MFLPFLKWAGGKRWFVRDHQDIFPNRYDRYFEPFLGSGAVFFALKPRVSILSDINAELIETYAALKRDWKRTFALLNEHDQRHSIRHYYAVRKQKPQSVYERAARFIYLNRTCWNGLYRVNRKGQFNVPVGTKQKVLLPNDNFKEIAESLRSSILMSFDFEQVIALASKRDLVFVDPPYTVKHNNNGFTKYNERLFCWEDQVRLRDSLLRARQRGAFVVCTNADTYSIRKLYSRDFRVCSLRRASVIAADAQNRGITRELVIRGW